MTNWLRMFRLDAEDRAIVAKGLIVLLALAIAATAGAAILGLAIRVFQLAMGG